MRSKAGEAPARRLAPPDSADIEHSSSELAGQRVAVALSGGVDSAVAALKLVQAGADVVGIALRLHDPEPENPLAPRACCAPDDLQDARRVAEALGIPFYVVDARDAFETGVVKPFVDDYLSGITPNPCVGCNSFVKLGLLWRRAKALGAARLATGHYARIAIDEQARPRIFRGVDLGKDQSYFLFGTDPDVIRHLLFPLGAMTKEEVRTRALSSGLPVAHKLDSQEVCFVGGKGAGGYVRNRPEAQGRGGGPIVEFETQETLGHHDGVAGFTVGQRRGIGLGTHRRLFVLGIDREQQSVIVGNESHLMKKGLIAHRPSWPAGAPTGPFRARAKVRYRDSGTPARIELLDDQSVLVEFESEVRAIAPGQAVVFFDDEEMIGGAWIREALG